MSHGCQALIALAAALSGCGVEQGQRAIEPPPEPPSAHTAPAPPPEAAPRAGEVLSQRARDRAQIYWLLSTRTRGAVCAALRFAPDDARDPSSGSLRAAVSYRYVISGDSVVIRGASRSDGRVTVVDSCQQTFRLGAAEEEALRVDESRWFFDQAACERARGTVPPLQLKLCNTWLEESLGDPAEPVHVAAEQERRAAAFRALLSRPGTVYWLARRAGEPARCEAWSITPSPSDPARGGLRRRGREGQDPATIGYGYRLEASALDGSLWLVLDGPGETRRSADAGASSLGSATATDAAVALVGEVATVGGTAWFTTSRACEAARAGP
jgi:hypothetical protein